MIINAKKDRYKIERFISKNRKSGRASLKKVVSHYKKLKKQVQRVSDKNNR